MKKMWKRFVSLLLACTLLAGMLPLSASAQATAPGEGSLSEWVKSKISELSEEDYTQAGPFPLQGSDLYQYTFTKNQYDNEGNLTQDAVYIILPGIGAANTQIPDYGEDSSLKKPWGESNASAVYIAKGVTGIGNHAFDGMTTLETLEIENPTSLKSVGDYAFNGCDKLVGPLDLSGVTDMGKYAFNGCERLGSGEDNEGVKLSDSLTEIPEYAFNGCGLTSVNIPEKVTSIGNSAFANNSLIGELNLPSSLITIGERAFYRYNSSSDTGGFSSITIPSSVTEIGANAFSGHKSLETVTLEHENKEKLNIADGAFGTDTYTAHNYSTDITVGDIKYENVSMGTQFLTKNDVGELLNNGVNCYLGDLKLLKFDHTELPTCLNPGYRYYEMTLEGASTGNEPVVVETKIEISAPGHSYVECEDLPATCMQPERTHEHCTNLDDGLVRSCEEEEKIRIKEGGKGALGHNYVVTGIENPTIGAGEGPTVITYTCHNWSVDEDKNLHDGDNILHSYSWKIEDKAVVASTANTLEELNLPSVQGVGNNYYAHLDWAVDGDKLTAPLEEGTHPYNVKLVVTGAGLTFPECTGIGEQLLQVTVQVDKIKLDFSQVEFQNNIRYVAQPNGDFGVQNLPEDAKIDKIEYRQNDDDTWEETAPKETEDNVGEYQVRVTFSYTSSKYLLDTDDGALQPPEGYTLVAGEELGTGTITGPYEIKQLTKDDLSVSSIPNLTYDGEKHNTVRIVGLPTDAKVTVTWKDAEGKETGETHTATETSMDVAGIIDAGIYNVTIKVEHDSFENGSAEITAQGVIAKKRIPTPKANTLESYTPEKEQIGVNDPAGEYTSVYKVTNNKQINAGTYEAIATLLEPQNYTWSTSTEKEVKISYTIPRRVVQKPGYTTLTYTFTGDPIPVLYRTNQGVLDGKYDENGNLTAFWKGYDKEYVVYTATSVQKTDVGTYDVTVALNNKEAQNYWWAGEDAKDYRFTWKINPQSINAPAVKVNNTTYDGEPYNTGGSDITLTGQSEVLVLGEDHKFYSNQSSSDPMQEAPTNAGTYYVQVDFDFKEGLNSNNYTITGNDRRRFTIEKAELTLTAPEEEVLTASFTGQNMTIPAPGVRGLQKEGDEYTLTYTYTFTPAGSEEAQSPVESSKAPEVSAAGIYEVKVTVPDTCQNYRATEAVTYTFRITSATQRVELESSTEGWNAEQSTVSKTLGDVPFTVTGKGYVNDVVVNEKDISYEVTGENTQNPVVEVDQTSGQVTLLRAGSATITVTAAGSANYGEATATYTITVDKGTPEIQAGDKEILYDGQQLVESDYRATVSGVEGAVVPSESLSYQFYQTKEAATEGGTEGKIDAPSAVGDYWLRVSYPEDANYLPAHKVVKVTITNAALFVTPDPYAKEYDGAPHPPATFTVTGVGGATLETDDYTVYFVKKEGQYADTAPDAKAEGVWDTALTVQDVADSGQFWYKIEADSYDPYVGEEPITVTISPKPLQIEKEVTARKPYDGTKEAIVNIGEPKTGVDGEEINVTDTHAEYDSAGVDASSITITYTLEAVGTTDLDNYSVSTGGKPIVGGSGTETVTEVGDTPVGITPAPITVAISDQSSVYDGKEPIVAQEKGTSEGDPKNWYVSKGTIYNSDNLDITLTVADAKNAGAYAITGEWTNKNYDVTFTGSWTGGTAGTYTITPRPIKVEIGNAEGFYGDEPDKTKVELTDISEGNPDTGLVSGDSLDDFLSGVTIDATASTGVGNDYSIVGEAQKYGNYDVTFSSGTYTVKARPITITIADHSSKYGAAINGGIAKPVSGTDYTVAITNEVTTGDAIVNSDDLGIALSTTANKDSNAGTYPISGEAKAEPSVVSNYAITWAGETPWSGSGQDSTEADSAKGTYTIDKAQLKVSVKRSDIYAQYGEEISNPVTFTNESTGQKIASDASDYTALSQAITYEMNPSDGLTQVEGSENAEGKFTVAVTQQMVTVTVNVAATENYEAATEITYHIHASASGSLDVSLPFADLTYNGQPQQLLAQAPELPDGVYIRYKVGEKGAWTEYSDADSSNWQTLVGTGAGDYTVYWETKAGGNYNASSGHETTEIKKADLSATYTGLNDSEVILVLSEMGDTYTIPLDLTGNEGYTHSNGDGVTFLSGNTDVAIAKNSTATLELRGVAGEAKITINCPGDNNYNPGTFTFTVKITDQKAEIKYNITGATTIYNGQPQTIEVKVTQPASGATVMYWNEKTSAYDLFEPPAYTDVKDSGTTIKFQITAPGYNTVTGEATLTINPKPIEEDMIAGIAESYTYTGKGITFDDAISVHDKGVLLEQNTDYTITYSDNTAVGTGSVTITGTGNYKESVTKNFTISPVDASDLTASLDHTFGYYGDSSTNNATVTVTHGRHTVDSSEIELTVTRQDSMIESGDVVKEGLKLTFNKAGIYTIHVEVSGTHKGAFDLTYTLLPQDVASDDFQVATDPEDRVWTYDGGNRAFGVTVTSGETSLQKGVDFTLRYTYLPYVGNPTDDVYDPGTTVFTEAGIYTVIVEGTGNYTGHAELVALIQPRDLSDADITAAFAQTGLVYNGEAQEPDVTLTYNGTPISQLKDTEYYGNTNAGEAQALSAASEDCNNFTGARVDAFTIEKKSLKDSTITAKADPEEYYYTGYPVTPAVTVTDSDRNVDLSIGADYTVTSDAVGPGKVTATVTGTGNYKDKVTVEFTILPTGAEPVETLNLTVTPSEWTWDNGQTKAAISVTFNGKELNDTDYQLTVSKDGETPQTVTKERAVELLSAPGEYTITATGVGDYKGSTDTETVTIQKIQPTVTVKATPNSLSGGGKVTLTLKGEKLPAFAKGEDLSDLLTVTVQNGQQAPDLTELEWTENQDGSLTAELTLPNTNETYTFALRFVGNDCYESASSDAMVVVGQQTSGGGGGSDPGDQPADPDDTGVSDWLNTKDHLAYLAGYPGGTFGPDQNMTRAEAAQMFYNLLLEKDVEITVEFEDVPADAWYAKPVNTLASLGILSGVGNGRFDPERSITRAEFTVIAMKFANTSGGGVNIFSDVNEDDWFYSAVVDSTQYGWINGYPDGTFRPEATISRAEVTVIVNHMLGRAADRPYVIAHEEELNTFGDVNRGHWGYFHVAEATNAHEYHTEDGTESWTGLS
ncbi:leucine-rich repeat protein [Acutalibacter sp. LFL-21]|uniref:leucine-rich repeat protein n=1 Tax=Acutalibacter sp. LFL-21 TaxID=2983399 RepID=UPI0021D65404|nr:leucine-rich repeat protein [Acutalibacter sp. LFL-21]MCU7651536.1 leucine-rich repeat protein [Acutalibacter sp. LFL-21]